MKKETGMPDWVKMEHGLLKLWEEGKAFDKLVAKNENSGKRFRFLDGPVTANNPMGVHHIWGRTLKDIAIKYKALTGHSCQYQNGFDAQGLWVEVNVEKELGLNGKPEILQYGLDKFTNKCLERVDYFGKLMTNQSIRIGQWMDWNNSYFTNTDENITSIWHFLKECDKRGMIEKRNRPMVWCPRCGTSLSEHEMTNSYKDVTHTALFIKLPVIGKNFKMVAWTTTPWTLTANVALAVNPENNYVEIVEVKSGEHLVLGLEAVKNMKNEHKVVREFKGEELIGLTYETCFPELAEQQFEHKVIPWKEVDSNEGSGVVHIAPGCGAEDFELGKGFNLPEICPINEEGVMLPNCGFVAGKKTTEVVDDVVNRLKADNKLVYAHLYKHSYPFCWRCKTDLVYKLVSTWYIKIDPIRQQLIDSIEPVEFFPAHGKKRMLDWLSNMGDWNISRSRFYGLPLPFYVCEKCNKVHVVGSVEELRKLAVNPEEIDKLPNIHRPWIDNVKIKCGCGEVLTRVTEVGDCWLDAGITPFSTKKFFTDKEYFNNNFPSDFVCESGEQIKLWFYCQLVMSVVLTGKAPYLRVNTYGWVTDENGNEFHKSGGNSLNCDMVADKVSADSIRYLYGGAPVTSDMRFGYTLAEEGRKKMLGLYNIYTFFNLYAAIDNPDIANFKLDAKKLSLTDKWLIETVNTFIENSKKNYDDYKSYLVVKDFEKLVDDISNFYIRINRKRFWKSDNKEDQLTAYSVLYFAIKSITLVMSPVTVFLSEYIWQNCVREVEPNAAEFVLLGGYPEPMFNGKFKDVVEDSEIVRNSITLAQRLRNENQLKIKQPLSKMYIISENARTQKACKSFEEVIKEELNIKEVIVTKDGGQFNTYYLGLNFKAAGAVLKGEVQKLKAQLEATDAKQMQQYVAAFEKGEVDIKPFGKLSSSLFVKNALPKKEFVIAQEQGTVVVLDITLTEELVEEGILREIIRNAQVLRKEADFNVNARIMLSISSKEDKVNKLIAKNAEFIKTEVLATQFNEGTFTPDMERDVEVAEFTVNFKMKSL